MIEASPFQTSKVGADLITFNGFKNTDPYIKTFRSGSRSCKKFQKAMIKCKNKGFHQNI